jgi:hypothetical protein
MSEERPQHPREPAEGAEEAEEVPGLERAWRRCRDASGCPGEVRRASTGSGRGCRRDRGNPWCRSSLRRALALAACRSGPKVSGRMQGHNTFCGY